MKEEKFHLCIETQIFFDSLRLCVPGYIQLFCVKVSSKNRSISDTDSRWIKHKTTEFLNRQPKLLLYHMRRKIISENNNHQPVVGQG